MSVRDRLTGIVTATFAFVSLSFALAMVAFLGRAAWIVAFGAGVPAAKLFAAAGCLVAALVFLALSQFDRYELVTEPAPRPAPARRRAGAKKTTVRPKETSDAPAGDPAP